MKLVGFYFKKNIKKKKSTAHFWRRTYTQHKVVLSISQQVKTTQIINNLLACCIYKSHRGAFLYRQSIIGARSWADKHRERVDSLGLGDPRRHPFHSTLVFKTRDEKSKNAHGWCGKMKILFGRIFYYIQLSYRPSNLCDISYLDLFALCSNEQDLLASR